MKLFVISSQNKVKKYLGITASSRRELFNILGSPYFTLDEEVFHINQVNAEIDNSSTAAGLIIGGIIGALAGPIGIITGATVGGLVGNSSDNTEKNKMIIFNNSSL